MKIKLCDLKNKDSPFQKGGIRSGNHTKYKWSFWIIVKSWKPIETIQEWNLTPQLNLQCTQGSVLRSCNVFLFEMRQTQSLHSLSMANFQSMESVNPELAKFHSRKKCTSKAWSCLPSLNFTSAGGAVSLEHKIFHPRSLVLISPIPRYARLISRWKTVICSKGETLF